MASAVDDDTRRAIAEGRETAGAVLSTAQEHLQKVFIVFVVGLVGTIYVLRAFVWDRLKADLFSRMGPEVRAGTEVVAVTPFDVILLQVKIGLVVGVVLAVPPLVYYSRDALRERGWWPAQRVARWKLVVIGGLSLVLFLGGVAYAYFLFFPFMFDFLAGNAIQAGFDPTYSIVMWAQFIFLLTLSFGLAAQLPLAMSAMAASGIVRYETFRDKWRYAVVGIFVFGAVFSPPDPFTQIMWAVPLVALYAFSLRFTRLVVVAKRSSEQVDVPATLRARWNVLAGTAFVVGAGVYLFFARGGIGAINAALTALPADYRPAPLRPLGSTVGLSPDVAAAVVAVVLAGLATAAVAFRVVSAELDRTRAAGPAPASAGAPAEIDLGELDAAGVRAAPPEVFRATPEDEILEHARAAMDADEPEKAEALFDRYDEVQAADEEGDGETADAGEGTAEAGVGAGLADIDPDDDGNGGDGGDDTGSGDSDVVTRTTAGMVDAFTEEETTEDDIGGYYYDIAFILESLTSKAFRIVGVFMVVMAATFIFLYRGGIGRIRDTFVRRMPEALQPQVDIVTLHPVEALIFEIKFAALLGAVATLPLVLYYAWPALKERGLARGDRRVLLVWGVTLLVGIVGGSLFGFLFVAPSVISWLATDALRSNMVIAYRINNFGWLVLYTTIGLGLLATVPVSMLLFHRGGLIPYATMRERWRVVVLGTFVFGAVVSPRGLFTMFLLALPAAFSYGVGLGLLWLYTLGGRRTPRERPESSAD